MSSHSVRLAQLHRRPRAQTTADRAWTGLVTMWRARQSRRLLAEMDDRLLADIGIGRGDALAESLRPMWDLRPR